MTFPWNCLMCPKSSFNNSPTFMLYKLVGSGIKEKLSMFVFMDSPRREYRSRESLAGVLVEVRNIRMVEILGIRMWLWSKKLKNLHVTTGLSGQLRASAWILETNTLRCGSCLWVWGQMPLSAWVDVFDSLFLFFYLWFCRSLSHFFSHLLGGASLSFSLAIACILFCLSLFFPLSESVSPNNCRYSWTAPTGLFAGAYASFWDSQPMGSFLADKSTAVCVPLRRNGNGTGKESMRIMDRVMGTGMELGIYLWRKFAGVSRHFFFENH